MSGELDERPDLTSLVRDLRDRVYELEHRISGDTNPLSLNDLEDVRVDSLGDNTISLTNGDPLVYRESDSLWVPGSSAGAGSTPTDWVEWEIPSTLGPFAWNSSEQQVSWTDDIANASHGTAITLSGGFAVVAADGWYTLNGYVKMTPVTGSAIFEYARLRLLVSRSFTIGSDFQDTTAMIQEVAPSPSQPGGAFYRATLQFGWTGYLMVGDDVKVFVQMSAPSDPVVDWEIDGGFFDMQRLPL